MRHGKLAACFLGEVMDEASPRVDSTWDIAGILDGVAAIAWPIAVLLVFLIFRRSIFLLLEALRRQVERGAAIVVQGIEIRGVPIDKFETEQRSSSAFTTNATASDKAARAAIYEKSRGIMLVHNIRRTGTTDKEGLPFFDLSIYLLAHQGYMDDGSVVQHGRLNDVDEVSFYLGDAWVKSKFGEWFTVNNGSEGFAVRFNEVLGPSLCVAKVKFHDKQVVELSRYIDMESVGGMKKPSTIY